MPGLAGGLLILAMALLFDIYCLRDLQQADYVQLLPREVWLFVICLSTPIGGILYLTMGRTR
jgi:hypothetical protein